jgi:DNA primase
MDTVQQIKDRLNIADVIGQYVKLTRAGANYKARCPFHSERTPSFTVSPSRGTYHCFGCGAGGDLFSFVQEIEALDFKGALKVLAERAGVTISYEHPGEKDERDQLFAVMETAARFFEEGLRKNEAAQAYLRSRGLTDDTIQSFRLGWAPNEWRSLTTYLHEKKHSDLDIEKAGLGKRTDKGMYDRFRSRIMFPIMDSAGRVVAFSGRIFMPEGTAAPLGEEPPKYLNSPETPLFHKSRILYGYDRAKLSIRKYNCTVLVEGQVDLVMSHQAGWSNTVAVSGTALTEEHVALVHRLSDNLILALDADEAGIRAAAKSARIALAAGMDVKVAPLPEGQDPADLIKTEGKEAWNAAMRSARHIIIFLMDILERTQKDPRAFARAVERGVIPFVASIKSPIDREHFVREVAGRIGMPEQTIREAVQKVLSDPTEYITGTGATVAAPESTIATHARERQLCGVYLWQQSLAKPSIELAVLEKKIKEAIGRTEIIRPDLSEFERESLRFGAEGLYGDSEHLLDDIQALIEAVRRERLRGELVLATDALRRAEKMRDEAAVMVALKDCSLLTAEIAKLDKVR